MFCGTPCSFKDVSRIFKWSFFCNFVAWISSQLSEQKEGLFSYEGFPYLSLFYLGGVKKSFLQIFCFIPKLMFNILSSSLLTAFLCNYFLQLSKPQPNLNTTVGFDMKMTLQTPPRPPPPTTETFQALLDELESWNLAQTLTRPIWLR